MTIIVFNITSVQSISILKSFHSLGNPGLSQSFYSTYKRKKKKGRQVDISSMAISNEDNQQQTVPYNAVEATGENVMAKHAAFFDFNNDGIVYPSETYKGFRAIGAGIPLSIGAILINVALSQKTRPGKFPSLLFPIEIKNITFAKHGSDTGVYDNQGRFVPQKFEDIFRLYAHTNPDVLTGEELKQMLKANREPKDWFGRIVALAEWNILYSLCKDKEGRLHKETIKAVYDGSLFEQMAKDKKKLSNN